MLIPNRIWQIISSGSSKDGIIDLSGCDVDKTELITLVSELNKYDGFTTLILYRNNINNDGATILSRLKYITKLNLRYNNINDDGVEILAQSSIKELDLSSNNLSNRSVEILIKYSKQTTINLKDNAKINKDSLLEQLKERISYNKEKSARNPVNYKLSVFKTKQDEIDTSNTINVVYSTIENTPL
jgi:Leucine-rich repeat (LRR) protein